MTTYHKLSVFLCDEDGSSIRKVIAEIGLSEDEIFVNDVRSAAGFTVETEDLPEHFYRKLLAHVESAPNFINLFKSIPCYMPI